MFGLQYVGLTVFSVVFVTCTLYMLSLRLSKWLLSGFKDLIDFGNRHFLTGKTATILALVFAWYGLLTLVAHGGYWVIIILSIVLAVPLGLYTVGLLEYFLADWNPTQIILPLIAIVLIFALSFAFGFVPDNIFGSL